MRKLKGNKIIILAVVVVLLFSTGTLLTLASMGYSSAFEGAKAEVYGVYYGGNQYTSEGMRSSGSENFSTPDVGLYRFLGTSLTFDPDNLEKGMPDLKLDMTTIFIPERSMEVGFFDWVPRAWTNELNYIRNPVKSYTWEVNQSDGSTRVYVMEQWLTKMYVSLEAAYDSTYTSTNPIIHTPPELRSEADDQQYIDTEIWFKIDVTPSWYFEDQPENTYFAIAKIQLNNVILDGEDVSKIDVSPESPGSALYLSYAPFMDSTILDETEVFESYYYENSMLNPEYFRDSLYIHLGLDDFGTRSWWSGLLNQDFNFQADVVTYELSVTQFVFGEWIVQDIQEEPIIDPEDPDYDAAEAFGRTAQAGRTPTYIPLVSQLDSLLGGLSGLNPLQQFGVSIGVFFLLIIALILVLFFTGVLTPLLAFFKGMGKKRGTKKR